MHARLLLVAVVSLSWLACGGTTTPPAATLSEIQSGIFTTSCAQAGCHSGANPAQGLNLESNAWAALVGKAATEASGKQLVVAGDPTNSFLLEKIEQATPSAGARMPSPPKAALTAAQIEQVRSWIADGAPNN